MPEVTCTTGGAEVIASGLGITYAKDAGYEIHVKFDDEFSLTVSLKFGADDPSGKPEMKPAVDTKRQVITLECNNFNDFVGTGTTKPLNIATYQGRKVYMNFWVRTPGNGENREVRYCFYLGEKNHVE